ncbi:MAG TPA: ABC transporter ATP-binding protein, partial [Aggregatilineales bacterium]|nr:ABC transporter ATP-binding protein [Aggregatilineales bacterium]
MTVILELQQVSKSFGALLVCNRINLQLETGVALGILGPNGAGKTTLMNLISGDLRLSSGRVIFQGQDISSISASKRCRMGISRTSQIPRPFIGMTVFENVLVGAMYGSKRAHHHEICHDVLQLTGLLDRWNVLAGDLRLLERKRLELARALATNPSLLLLDEIAGGLTDHEVTDLLEIIATIRARGITIIWIEHIVHALISSVDRILAINFGTKLAEGNPQDIIN